MPIAVTKYRCQFKCGRTSRASKKEVESHEASCWNNPANRACRSCKHEIYGWCGDGETEPHHAERDCRIPLGKKYLDVAWEKLQTTGGHIKPIFNCPLWESKGLLTSNIK